MSPLVTARRQDRSWRALRAASRVGTSRKAIILGNLALAHVRQHDIEQAATVLHRAIDLLEVSRGGGGLNVVSAAVRELRPWRHEPLAQDVNERLLTLMTLN